jgi:hypothetical protein
MVIAAPHYYPIAGTTGRPLTRPPSCESLAVETGIEPVLSSITSRRALMCRLHDKIIWRRGGGNDPPTGISRCNSFQDCSAHLCADPSLFNSKRESGIATDQRSRHIFPLHRKLT